MRVQIRAFAAIFCAAALFAAANSACAADEEPDRWRLITTPFVWASGLEGDGTIRGVDLHLDLGFDDIFEATDFGMQTYLELRKRDFGFFAAPSYLKLSGDASSRLFSADFKQEWWTVEGGGFVTLADTGGDTPFTLDLYAGVRYWNVNTEVDVHGAGPLGADLHVDNTFEILDPIIGLRIREYITPRLSVAIRGDVGGFGISAGETSEFSWQALGLLGYDLSKRFTVFGGYRALAIDAEEDSGNKWDVIFQGFMVGLQVRW